MNRSYPLVVFLIIAIFPAVIFAQDPSPFNLVPNPGFEDEFASWSLSQYPSGWEVDHVNAYIGDKCCVFTFPGGTGYYDAQIDVPPIELEPGYEYYFGVHTYEYHTHDTFSSEKTIFDIILRDVNTGYYHVCLPQELTTGWTSRSNIFTVPELCTVQLEIHIHGYTTSNDALAFVDNVLLGILPPISNEEVSWGQVKKLSNSE